MMFITGLNMSDGGFNYVASGHLARRYKDEFLSSNLHLIQLAPAGQRIWSVTQLTFVICVGGS